MSFPTSLLSDPTLGAMPFTITRKFFTPVNGTNTIRSSTTTSAVGCIHPATQTDLNLLPEEYRHREVIVIYTQALLSLGADGAPSAAAPDEITWNGRIYRLIRVKNWGALGFCQGFAAGLSEGRVP